MTTSEVPVQGVRPARSRTRKVATPEMSAAQIAEPLEEKSALSMPLERKSMFRRALKPLKEVYFVGIGAIDWTFEKAVIVEKSLSQRGHRRNEMLGRVASKVSANVGEKTRKMSDRGRSRVKQMSGKMEEGMQEMTPMPPGAPETA